MNRIRQRFDFEIAIGAMIILITAWVIGALVWDLYGHVTQNETLVIEVVDKETRVTTSINCVTVGNPTNCTPVTTTYYRIIASDETFTTSRTLYYQIVVGKTHVVRVTGWPGGQIIREILE